MASRWVLTYIISKQWSEERRESQNIFPCDKNYLLWITSKFSFAFFLFFWLMDYVLLIVLIEFVITRNCSQVGSEKLSRKNFHFEFHKTKLFLFSWTFLSSKFHKSSSAENANKSPLITNHNENTFDFS